MPHRWRLRTLGGLSLLRDGIALTGAPAQRRRLAILAVVAAAGDVGVSRDRLQAMFWPESDSESARHALNQLLFLIRRDHGSQILSGTAELRLGSEDFSTDLLEIERAAAAGDDEDVVALYAGPFLDGFHLKAGLEFERWQDEKRAQLSKLYSASLERLATAATARGDHLTAAAHWRRLTIIDPLNARFAIVLMRSLAATGEIPGALQHAKLHAALLSAETGLEPDAAVLALETELRRRHSDPPDGTVRLATEGTSSLGNEETPTEVPSGSQSVSTSVDRPWRRIYTWMAASAALVAGLWFVTSLRGTRPDEGLIAVAPFDVLDPELALWREGMMDVLARALDGAGPLRSVSATTVMRNWPGRSDVASARELGRRSGATLVVLGTLLRSGRDSVRGTTTLIDAQTGDIIAERESRDDIMHIDRVADSLAVAVLRDIGVRQPLQAVRTASLGSAPLPALKAFLRGEQLIRAGRMDSARVFYARAAELDHHFALALHRLSWTQFTTSALVVDSSYRSNAFRAQVLNHGLPRRDSLLVLLDSLRIAGEFNYVLEISPITVQSGRRILAVALQLAHDYPTDPEAQYQLGDVRVHFAPLVGTQTHVARADFDRAIALDSSYAPAYEHVVTLAFRDQDVTGARRYIAAIERYAPLSDMGRAAPLLDAMLAQSSASTDRLTRLLDSLPLYVLYASVGAAADWMDPAETGLRLETRMVERTRREQPTLIAPALGAVSMLLAERGHLRQAREVYARGATEDPRLYVELAMLGAVPHSEADQTFHRWLSGDDLLTASRAAPVWSAHGDSQTLKELQLRVRRPNPADSIGIGRYLDWSLTLYLALARFDTSAALAMCGEMQPETLPFRFLEDIDCGRILIARGRYREAVQLLGPQRWTYGPIVRVMRTLEWARASELAGDRRQAAAGYAFVNAAWRNGEPSLRARLRNGPSK
jgi:DNA-binding SARP family transcriptional activator/TolB-like protein